MFCRLLVFFGVLAMPLGAQRSDSTFSSIPFEDWRNGSGNSNLKWSLVVHPPHLTENQRLQTAVTAEIDGEEFTQRRGRGPMVFLFEVRDHEGRAYRGHRSLALSAAADPNALAKIRFFETICVAPGDYRIEGAIYDRSSKEHNWRTMELRVPALARDPLAAVWSSVPDVAIGAGACRVRPPLKAEPAVPTRVDIVENRSNRFPDRVLPRMTFLSELAMTNGSVYATLVDVHSKMARMQPVRGTLDVRGLFAGFPPVGRRTVNPAELATAHDASQFFVSKVRDLLETRVSESERVLIVLSEPMRFPKGEDLSPIELRVEAGTRVFYVRCDYPQFFVGAPPMGGPSGPGTWADPPELPSLPPVHIPKLPTNADSLEALLKPLSPKVFHAMTALQFRRALAEIVEGISSGTRPSRPEEQRKREGPYR